MQEHLSISMRLSHKENKISICLCFALNFALFLVIPRCVLAFVPNDPYYSYSAPYLEKIDAPSAWDKTVGSRSVIISVLDSGIDIDHQDLKSNIWVNISERMNGLDDDGNGYIDDVNGWDFVNNDNGVGPDVRGTYEKNAINHGTVVAGIAGAVGNNGIDSTGIAMNVTIMPLKVMDNNGSGEVQNVIKAIEYAIKKKVSIINLSFSGNESSKLLKDAVRKAADSGIVVVVAAGNDNDESDSGNLDLIPKFPVCADKGNSFDFVIGVGAVDKDDIITDFSNFGSCIDLVAPGKEMVSTLYHDENSSEYRETLGGYFSGTSLAAPIVSGSAALLKSLHPDWSAEDIIAALYLTADSVDFKNPSRIGALGHGRVNIGKASRVKFDEIEFVQNKEIKPSGIILASPSKDGLGEIRLFDVNEGFLRSFQPIGTTNNGIEFVVDDIDNNLEPEIIIAGDNEIVITTIRGEIIRKFATRDKNKSKLSISTADINGDGYSEIITSRQFGSNKVLLYTYQGYDLGEFIGSSENVNGLRVVAGDITGDNVAEIITASTGGGEKAQVWVHLNDGNLYTAFRAFNKNENVNDLVLSLANIDGINEDEIIIGKKNSDSLIRIFSYFGAFINEFYVFDKSFIGGVNLSYGDIEGDGVDEIVVGAGAGGGPHVKMLDAKGAMKNEWFVFDKKFRGGVNVGFYK